MAIIMKFKLLFILFSILFLISSGYHLAALFFPLNESPPWRNMLFTVINILAAAGLLKRPAWFIFPYILLMIQQLYSHGSDLVGLWNAEHRFDWISMLVLMIMPAIFVFLVADRTARRNKTT